jgi:hypothetical protein
MSADSLGIFVRSLRLIQSAVEALGVCMEHIGFAGDFKANFLKPVP